jgi:hypothetical protein
MANPSKNEYVSYGCPLPSLTIAEQTSEREAVLASHPDWKLCGTYEDKSANSRSQLSAAITKMKTTPNCAGMIISTLDVLIYGMDNDDLIATLANFVGNSQPDLIDGDGNAFPKEIILQIYNSAIAKKIRPHLD